MAPTKQQEKVTGPNLKQWAGYIGVVVVLLGLIGLFFYLVFNRDEKDDDASTASPTASPSPSMSNEIKRGEIYSMAMNTVMVPKEVILGGASRAVPMSSAARDIIHKKYMPQMIGVPGVGEPFRLALPAPMKDSVLRELLDASRMEGEDIVFIKTSTPPVLFGFMSQISGELQAYCDQNGADCTEVDVFYSRG